MTPIGPVVEAVVASEGFIGVFCRYWLRIASAIPRVPSILVAVDFGFFWQIVEVRCRIVSVV
jgi:hypothetical protein